MYEENKVSYEKIFSMSKKEIESNYEYLGEGAGRIVYAINKKYVIKLSKNKGGDKQCETENYIYNNAESHLKKLLCPVAWYKEDMLIMKRGRSLERNNRNRYKNVFKMLDIGMDDPLYKKVRELSKRYDLLYSDITNMSSWGLLDGTLVLLDYGCTREIFKEFFS